MGPVKLKEVRMRLSAMFRAAEQGESVAITGVARSLRALSRRGTSILEESPDLAEFRASLKATGKPLSQLVIEGRRKARY